MTEPPDPTIRQTLEAPIPSARTPTPTPPASSRGLTFFLNEEVSATCDVGYDGTVVIPAGRIVSFVSQEDANAIALSMAETFRRCEKLAVSTNVRAIDLSYHYLPHSIQTLRTYDDTWICDFNGLISGDTYKVTVIYLEEDDPDAGGMSTYTEEQLTFVADGDTHTLEGSIPLAGVGRRSRLESIRFEIVLLPTSLSNVSFFGEIKDDEVSPLYSQLETDYQS